MYSGNIKNNRRRSQLSPQQQISLVTSAVLAVSFSTFHHHPHHHSHH